jgi:ferric-dicitrate binding protein FerR (iron transport regulator)
MTTEPKPPHPDEAGIEELLREVGARDEPTAETSRSIEEIVRAEWQSTVAQRRRSRRRVTWGVAASLAVAIGAGIYGVRQASLEPVDVAAVARVDGQLLAGPREEALQSRAHGARVRTNEILKTDARSRVALTFANDVSVRMNHDTTLILAATDRVTLRSGAIYVDSPRAFAADTLVVETRAGSVRHVGTQYQVRTHADAIEVSIREGRVVIESDGRTNSAVAGESIRLGIDGELARAPINADDPAWAWAAQAAPRFDIDNQTLAAFLDWLGRETGRRVVYASREAQDAAQQVKLRGSIEGLDLETALTAVLSTTNLRRHESPPGAIGIGIARANDSPSSQRPTE